MGVTHGPLWTLEDEYSMQFDGTDDSITTGLDCSSATHPDISVSCWLKVNSHSGIQFPVGVECTNSHYISLGLLNGGTIYYKANDVWVSGGSVADGNWHNVIWTFSYNNPTSDDMTVKVYKDGNTTPVIDTVDNTYQLPALTGNLFIGSEEGTSWYFNGEVDEVGVWDRILTPTEVSAIYSNGNPINLTPFNPLVWYRMGDNAVFKDPQWLLPENSNKDKVSNYSMSFDGTDGNVRIGPPNTSLGITSAITISCWAQMTGSTAIGPAILGEDCECSTGVNMNRNWSFILIYNQLFFELFNTGGGPSQQCIDPGLSTIQDGNWHHVMGTYDGTSGLTGQKLYIDGSLVASNQTDGTGTNTGAQSLFIGAAGPLGYNYNWDGEIDEVSVWDSVKTIADVSDNNIPIDLTGKSNLIGWWRMGDMAYSGGTADIWVIPDSSTNNNTGFAENQDIEDRVGDAPSSSGNTLSYNMELNDRVNDTPG